jgi:hypothetical protein
MNNKKMFVIMIVIFFILGCTISCHGLKENFVDSYPCKDWKESGLFDSENECKKANNCNIKNKCKDELCSFRCFKNSNKAIDLRCKGDIGVHYNENHCIKSLKCQITECNRNKNDYENCKNTCIEKTKTVNSICDKMIKSGKYKDMNKCKKDYNCIKKNCNGLSDDKILNECSLKCFENK